jgi:hypothetical protein
MPFKEAAFWACLTMVGTGLYFVFEPLSQQRMFAAILLVIIGLIGMAYLVYQYHYADAKLPSTGIWVWLPLIFTSVFGYVIYSEHFKTMPPPISATAVQPTISPTTSTSREAQSLTAPSRLIPNLKHLWQHPRLATRLHRHQQLVLPTVLPSAGER